MMKPGPAISAEVTSSSFASSATSASARSRGFSPAGLASTIAALVARSPCEGSRGGSTVIAPRLSPPGSVPAASSASSAALRWPAKAAYRVWFSRVAVFMGARIADVHEKGNRLARALAAMQVYTVYTVQNGNGAPCAGRKSPQRNQGRSQDRIDAAGSWLRKYRRRTPVGKRIVRRLCPNGANPTRLFRRLQCSGP
ncbi:hypothetical protein SPHV1_320017 [Novosphingobium sp. KN65.2]|nr:hypothetical protein SPHV1_320017 [Novosphingobium sp. KN65.2]